MFIMVHTEGGSANQSPLFQKKLEQALGKLPPSLLTSWKLGSTHVVSTDSSAIRITLDCNNPLSFLLLDGFPTRTDLARLTSQPLSLSRFLEFKPCGSFNIVYSNPTDGTVTIIGERNGLRPIYAYWNQVGSLILSSHIQPIQALVGNLNPNTDAIVEQLAVSSVLGTATLSEHVHRVGQRVPLTIRGGRVSQAPARSSSEPRVRNLNYSPEQICDLIRSTISEVSTSQRFTTALSGGLDSRLLTLVAKSAGFEVDGVTLGRKGWLDVDLAAQFSTRVGLPHRIVEPPTFNRLDTVLNIILEVEHISDYLSPLWLATYRDALRELKHPVLNGFLGGPLSGALDTSNDAASAIDTMNKCAVRWSSLAALLRYDVTSLRLRSIAHAKEISTGSLNPGRTIEMALRQVGFVAQNTLGLYRKYCGVLTPYSQSHVIDVFNDLPPQARHKQQLYVKALQSLDTSQTPLNSTGSRLYRPQSFTNGPMGYLFREYLRLRPELVSFLEDNARHLNELFKVSALIKAVKAADRDPLPVVPSFTEVLLLFNAAVWYTLYKRRS